MCVQIFWADSSVDLLSTVTVAVLRYAHWGTTHRKPMRSRVSASSISIPSWRNWLIEPRFAMKSYKVVTYCQCSLDSECYWPANEFSWNPRVLWMFGLASRKGLSCQGQDWQHLWAQTFRVRATLLVSSALRWSCWDGNLARQKPGKFSRVDIQHKVGSLLSISFPYFSGRCALCVCPWMFVCHTPWWNSCRVLPPVPFLSNFLSKPGFAKEKSQDGTWGGCLIFTYFHLSFSFGSF